LKGRVQVQNVTPTVDCGRYAAKAVVDQDVVVAADVFREGHDKVAAAVRYRGPEHDTWEERPLRFDANDRFFGSFRVDAIGAWRFQVVGWTDHYASWLDGLVKKHEAGQTDLDVEFEEGARLLKRRKAPKAVKDLLRETAAVLRGEEPQDRKVAAATDTDLQILLQRHPERLDATTAKPDLPLWVDREAAEFSAWYELFPRSEGAQLVPEVRSGTFSEAAKRLPAVADMGFDVVYLPPIHPIGRQFRKGPNNTLTPAPDDPGVPWAIGSSEGGHKAVHPDLGTIEDFDDFVAEAGRHGLEVALDFAIQCSPDHPWAQEHPEWFKQRADGTIAYAENPPKKYQDIYPIDFDTSDIEGLRSELKSVLDFWIGHGVKIFRVDNPHTKALPFWEWLIAAIHLEHPDVLFLAEAFTKPKMMQTLGKLGFSQSYTYFAWRNAKWELEEYLTELAHSEMADYYRPNFWPNTPDILTEYLQHGGRPAFKIRAVLAALMSPSWGLYSGYELCEHVAVREGSEEYLDSEKYQYRPRNWDDPSSLAPYITRLNEIRRNHAGFRRLRSIWFHTVSDDNLIAFSRVGPGRTDPVLTVVNLDPYSAQAGETWLDMWQLGLENAGPYEAHDLLTDTTYIWHGPGNYVHLDPHDEPAHVLRLRAL
jgi:starch synthase (maltosyl-transferring)